MSGMLGAGAPDAAIRISKASGRVAVAGTIGMIVAMIVVLVAIW